MSREIRAGKAYVEVGVRDRVSAALKKLEGRFNQFSAAMRQVGRVSMMAGAAITTALAGAVAKTLSMGDALAKASSRTGIAVEDLSTLKYAADQSGASLESLETSIKAMNRVMGEAAGGSKAAQSTLEELGTSVEELLGMNAQQRFMLLSDAIASIQDPGQRAAAAMKVFGKSGTDLLPMLAGGAAGIRDLQRQARDLGLQMSTEDARAAEEFGDRLADLKAAAAGATFTVGAALLPALQRLIKPLIEAAKSAAAFIKQNSELVMVIAKVGAAAVTFGALAIAAGHVATAVMALGAALKLLVAANPVMLGVAGLTAILGVAFIRAQALTRGVDGLTDALEANARANRQTRTEDQARLDRLKKLGQQTELTRAQQMEASRIIDTLTGRYGDLGISIDSLTGRLSGLEQAQIRVNKAMRDAALAELNAQVAQRQANLATLQSRFDELGMRNTPTTLSYGDFGLSALGPVMDRARFLFGGEQGLQQIQNQMDAERAALKALQQRIAAARAGDNSDVVGEAQNAATALMGVADAQDEVARSGRGIVSMLQDEFDAIRRGGVFIDQLNADLAAARGDDIEAAKLRAKIEADRMREELKNVKLSMAQRIAAELAIDELQARRLADQLKANLEAKRSSLESVGTFNASVLKLLGPSSFKRSEKQLEELNDTADQQLTVLEAIAREVGPRFA